MEQEQKPDPSQKPQDPSQKKPVPAPPNSQVRGILAWLSILGLVLITVMLFKESKNKAEEISYSPGFTQFVQDGRIEKCEIIQEYSGVSYVKGELKPAADADTDTDAEPTQFKVYLSGSTDELQKFLIQNGVEFRVPPQNPYLWQMLLSILPIVLIFGLLYFLFMRQVRNAGHGAMSFGKSRARMLNRDTNKLTFENVAGIDEAEEEVQEIIDFLKDPKRFQKLGGRIPKGVLLMGPPGTGKTLLAKAIAGEADVPFFSISGSDFVEMFVGVGASRVRDMFEQGRKHAPCIIFIDEIDAVGRSRFSGIGGGHDEREQTLNAMLVQMDGFETQEGVIILAATNRPDVLDPALLRPGRFDRQIVIDLPLIDGREEILKLHAKKVTLASNADLRRIARGTPGFSGADLENLLNEAALLASRQNKEGIELADLEEARDKVKWGRERRSRKIDDKEKKLTAYHEAGHALVIQMLEHTEPLHKITIIPRGVAYLGATMSLPDKDRYTESRQELLDTITGSMGGLAAEEIVFGDITNGASSDLKHSTQIARMMICNWGMSEDLGPQRFEDAEELLFLGREVSRTQNYSEETARKIDAEISKLLRDSHARATTILTENRDKLEMIARRLLEFETIDGRDVEEIVKSDRVFSQEERDEEDGIEMKEEPGAGGPSEEGFAETPPPIPETPPEDKDQTA